MKFFRLTLLLLALCYPFQYVFCSDNSLATDDKLPYFFYHYSECKDQDALIDTLLDNYNNYTSKQQVQVIDFAVDSLMSNGYSFNLLQFLCINAKTIPFSKSQKDKLMEITVQKGSAQLFDFWTILNDVSYLNPLHNWWVSHPNSDVNKFVETALFALGDSEIVEKWMKFIETEPTNKDTLDKDYTRRFERIIRYGNNKTIYDRLLKVMIKHPDNQLSVGFHYPNYSEVYEPLSMFFYRNLAVNIKGAPLFDYDMRYYNMIKQNNVMYFKFPNEYKNKYLNWCNDHINKYELIK